MELFSDGNQDLLKENPIAFFCSRNIPLSVYYPALDLFQEIFRKQIVLAGGWQSAMEKQILKKRLPGDDSKVIFFLAKGIDHFKLPQELEKDFKENKVLIISLWKKIKRPDRNKIRLRNDLILRKINKYFFLYIDRGGNLNELFHWALLKEKDVFVFDHASNKYWIRDKVKVLSEKNLEILG